MIKLLLLVSTVFVIGCDSVEKLFLEEDLLERPPSERCGECHTKIYNQWKQSRHSQAWVSQEFIKKTNNRTKSKCLSCHAPLEVYPIDEPVLREKLREEGVNCFSCHYREKTNSIHGPYKVFSPPHYSTHDPDYLSSKICAGCHKKTYQSWKATRSEKNCQECHMPHKKDRLIQKFPFKYFHSKKDLHDHRFLPLKSSEKDYLIDVEKKSGLILVKIKNIKIPHILPASQQGKPKFYLQVQGFHGKDEIFKENFMITTKNGFQFKKWKEFEIYYRDVNRVVIYVYRKLSWKKEKEPILVKEFQLD